MDGKGGWMEMGLWVGGWMDGWLDGWMDVWMDGHGWGGWGRRMDGCMRKTCFLPAICDVLYS